MKYFCEKSELNGTCYHEFFAGRWDDRFWNEDSLYIGDEEFRDCGLRKLFREAIPDYSPYDSTEVFPEEWENIKAMAEGEAAEALAEADEWAKASFAADGMFTILGI